MTFLLDALIFMAAALIVVPIGKRLGLSPVLGYLLAGVLIGPGGIELIGDADGVLHFAEIGVVFLLFIIGLELQPSRLWVMRKEVFGLGTAQVILTTAGIAVLIHVFIGMTWTQSSILGFALALSSTAFVLQLLTEQKQLMAPYGRAAFGILLLQDIAVIPGLAVISLLGVSAASSQNINWSMLGLVVIGLVASRFLLRPVLRFIAATGIDELFAAGGLLLVLGAALAMNAAGISMGLGAFIAGMMVADSEYRHQIETDILPFKGLLLGLFFIAVGMSADLHLLASEPIQVLGATLALVLLKAALMYPVARVRGLDHAEAIRTSVVLSQGGEFAFVLLTAAASAALLPVSVAEFVILVVTLSMVTTPFLMKFLKRLIQSGKTEDRPFDEMAGHEHPVVIAGFGRVGQIVARVLNMHHIPFTALEANPKQVDFVRQYGSDIYYGDASRLDSLRAAKVPQAKIFVLTLEDIEQSVKIAEIVHRQWPQVLLLVRARNRHHEMMLREIGVQFVIRDTLLSTLELSKMMLVGLGRSPEAAAKAVDAFRLHDAETLLKQAAVFRDETAFRQTTLEAADELKLLFSEDAASSQDKGP
jgi:monovalent cation:proton antiporter-2 (CPA2) family protein